MNQNRLLPRTARLVGIDSVFVKEGKQLYLSSTWQSQRLSSTDFSLCNMISGARIEGTGSSSASPETISGICCSNDAWPAHAPPGQSRQTALCQAEKLAVSLHGAQSQIQETLQMEQPSYFYYYLSSSCLYFSLASVYMSCSLVSLRLSPLPACSEHQPGSYNL